MWCVPVITALGRPKLVDYKFKTHLGYTADPVLKQNKDIRQLKLFYLP